MTCTAVGLRIVGDDLDPDEVTRLLAVNPTGSMRKGEVVSVREIVARTGTWQLSDDTSGNLDAKIAALLARLPSDLSVWRELSQRYLCDIFCGLFMRESNEGAEVAPATLALLGERGLRLGLDLYAPPE